MKDMYTTDHLQAKNGEREIAIAMTRKLFKAIEKQARPVVYEENIPSPKLDFPERSYHDIHNAYAESIASMQNRRRNFHSSGSDNGDYTPMELSAEKMALARKGHC